MNTTGPPGSEDALNHPTTQLLNQESKGSADQMKSGRRTIKHISRRNLQEKIGT